MSNLTAKEVAEQVIPADPLLRLAEIFIQIDHRENVIKDDEDVDKRNTNNDNQAV